MQKWKKYILISDILSLYLSLVLALIVRGLIHTKAIQTESVWVAAHLVIFLPSVLISLLTLYISNLYDAKTIFDALESCT
jgi:type IV secretory pathway TrbL component